MAYILWPLQTILGSQKSIGDNLLKNWKDLKEKSRHYLSDGVRRITKASTTGK